MWKLDVGTPLGRRRLPGLVAAAVLLIACGTFARETLDADAGPADPTKFDRRPVPAAGAVSFEREVKPLFERRCVICHACYDAPCQLKLTSWEGVARGGSKTPVYDTTRVVTARPSRLYEDATTTSAWRRRDFFPVLNEHRQNSEANVGASLLFRMLEQKRRHPTPTGDLLPATFELSLAAKRQCPRLDEHATYEKEHPLWGMPYGLPPLTDAEHALIERWLAAGAPAAAPAPLPPAVAEEVQRWEEFLRRKSTFTAKPRTSHVRPTSSTRRRTRSASFTQS